MDALGTKCQPRQAETGGQQDDVWDFAMHDRSDALLYWLFFSTGSLRGLEEMKRAMEKVIDLCTSNVLAVSV